MKFGEYVKRFIEKIRGNKNDEMLLSLKGLGKSDLRRISSDGGDLLELISPALLEYDHYVLEMIALKKGCTMGDVYEIMRQRLEHIISAAEAEYKSRKNMSMSEEQELINS